jgi:predicted PurR-regulated permease PerM
MAAAGFALCFWVARPFIPGLAWALAFAVVAYPIHARVAAVVRQPSLAAIVSVAIVCLIIVGPMILVGWQIASQAAAGVDLVRQGVESGDFVKGIENYPRLATIYHWIAGRGDFQDQITAASAQIQTWIGGSLRGVVSGVVQLLTALFALFYFFRDRDGVLGFVRSVLPLSAREANDFLERIGGIIHATFYGTIVVATVQGALGGLMFWVLGVPGALVWGFAMAVLSIVPVLGAFVIWAPAAFWLASQGLWIKAVILTLWGTIVVGFIDNLLYPALVGKEIRLHTLPVFIAIIGGLATFGAAGVVIGPVILAATVAILDILDRRTVRGRSAETRS